MAKTYYLVIYDESQQKGVSSALPSVLDEEAAKIMLQDANPTVHRKANGRKYQVTSKRLFVYKNLDGTETLSIVCDATRIGNDK